MIDRVHQDRAGWLTIVASGVIAGAVLYLLMTVVYRYVLGDSWDWSRAAGGAIAGASVWVGIGVATRLGWVPPSRRRDGSDRTT